VSDPEGATLVVKFFVNGTLQTTMNAAATLPGTNTTVTHIYAAALGTHAVEITADDGIADPVSCTTEFAVRPAQTITFEAIANRVFGDPPVPLVATSSTGLPVTFEVGGGTTSITVSGNEATIVGAGFAGVVARQAGNAEFAPASAFRSFTIAKATPVLTWDTPADIVFGTPLGSGQLNAQVQGMISGSYGYSPGPGTVLGVGDAQTLQVTFTPTDTTRYNTAIATVQINVTSATPVITWPTPAAIVYGTALGATQLNATASVPGTFVYTPAAGTVLNAGDGQILSVAFTPADATRYVAAAATVQINVGKATPVITWATPAAIVYGTALGATQLNATASVPGMFVYTPAAGTVLGAGNAQRLSVSFTPADAVNYRTAGAEALISVTKATPLITWANPAAIVYGTALGATQLNATASTAGTFVYTPAAGTVLNAGNGQVLSGVFTPADTANYDGATATAKLDVTRATPVITWANPAHITFGTALGAAQLNATATVAGTLVYTPPAGTLLNAGAGQTLSVTFAPGDSGNYNGATVTALLTVTKATPLITWANSAAIVYGTALGATQLNATASAPGTFAYVPAAGTVLGAGNGQALSATFTPTDTANYTTATATVQIDVSKAAATLAWPNPAAIVYGTALGGAQLNATASVAGSFAYTPAAGTILNAGNGQTLTATFTPADTANYTGGTTTAHIDVSKATSVITWANPADLVYGTALGAGQLNATASVAGSFTYTPGAGTVLDAGSGQALSAEFTPTDTANYTGATATAHINVTKAAPVITWLDPADIVYGTALGGAQLNATSSVPGTFVYTPAAGTVLNAGGSQLLSVTFTPAAGGNYAVAGATVRITVQKATPSLSWMTPAAIVYGTALGAAQLNATASVAGAFTYTPGAGTVPGAGLQSLSVVFTPADAGNYTGASASVTIQVQKATPVVTWATPVPIIVGTPLGATQLNASANTAGTFAYTPAAGTVLPIGSSPLSVLFTPADAANFTTATGTVTITVAPATPVFSELTSPSIVLGATPTVLTGRLTAGTLVPSGSVTVVVNGVSHAAALQADGRFTASVATGALTVAGSPHTVTYAYAGDGVFAAASATGTIAVHHGFGGLQSPYGPPSSREFKAGSAVVLKWQYTDSAGRAVSSAAANPTVLVDGPVACGTTAPGSAVSVNAPGSGGYRYSGGTWQLNWKTTGLAAGCYNIRIRNGQTGHIDGPLPIRLR
jgi:hypothetical protein